MTTRACVDACARLDAEATKGTARWMVRSFLATTRTVTDDGRIHSIHAVGVFFRDDADADVVDDERARDARGVMRRARGVDDRCESYVGDERWCRG